MPATDNNLREQLHREIDRLCGEELRATGVFIAALKQEPRILCEPAEAYITAQEPASDEETFDKELIEVFKNVDYGNRQYQPDEKLYTLDEVFDRLTDRMSLHYGVDMRKLSDRYK